jgi:hypothetical protein
LQQYTLAEDHVWGSNGAVFKKDTVVKLKADGLIHKVIFAKPWTDPQANVSYKADTEYTF